MRLALSRIHYPVRSLGPGNRVGIWFQGCSIRCAGCISADTWTPNRGATTVDTVFESIREWLEQADGVTISGGEPFDQPDALRVLLRRIRDVHSGDILVYSGYALEALQRQLAGLEGLIDALIADPFDNQRPQSLALRGSDNQRLVSLTSLGQERFGAFARPLRPGDRYLDLMIEGTTGEIWFAGIPFRDDFKRLTELLQADGHRAITTEDGRPSK